MAPAYRVISVVIVEDHALTRAGVAAALAGTGEMIVSGEAADGLSGFEEIARSRPDVAVLDIGLPDIDGIELTRRVRAPAFGTRIVILTMQTGDVEVFAAFAAGADAYVVKASDPSNLVSAVRIAAEGGAYFDPQIAHVAMRHFGGESRAPAPGDNPLTPREIEVLRLIADGFGNVEIAERLQMGLGTVKGHVHDLFRKLRANDRAHAAVNAYRRGLL